MLHFFHTRSDEQDKAIDRGHEGENDDFVRPHRKRLHGTTRDCKGLQETARDCKGLQSVASQQAMSLDIEKRRETGSTAVAPRSCRSRKTAMRHDKIIVREMKKNPFTTSLEIKATLTPRRHRPTEARPRYSKALGRAQRESSKTSLPPT